MAKFCGKCGTRLDEATGLCPNCDASALKEKQAAPAKAEKAAAPKMEKPEKKKKSGKWLVLLVAAAVVIAAVVFALAKFGVIGGDDYEVPRVDADDYFEDNATVLDRIKAQASKEVMTEQEVLLFLEERGFNQSPVTTNYGLDGTYYDAKDVSGESTEKHPIYQTLYQTEDGAIWTVVVINGQIMANPATYNLQAGWPVKTAVSETNTITSYDSTTNLFYKTIPNESALKVVQVSQIDAETLERLTAEEIELLW